MASAEANVIEIVCILVCANACYKLFVEELKCVLLKLFAPFAYRVPF